MSTTDEISESGAGVAAQRLQDSGRVLGFVLAVAAIIWIAAAITVDRELATGVRLDTKTLSGSLWGAALTFFILGVWAPSLGRPNLFSFIGSALAFAGGVLLTVLVLRAAAAAELPNGDTLKGIAVAVIGVGMVFFGVSFAFGRHRSLILGAVIALAGIVWGIFGIVDYGTDTERYVSIAPAIALLLAALTIMLPRLLQFEPFGRRSGATTTGPAPS